MSSQQQNQDQNSGSGQIAEPQNTADPQQNEKHGDMPPEGPFINDGDPKHEGLREVGSHLLPREKRFGREIAFGLQQTLACWATDFIDPYIGKWYQNKYGNKAHEVTSKHTWGGEIFGDSAAFFVYIGAKRLFTRPIDAITKYVKKAADPVLDPLAARSLRDWKKREGLSDGDVRYRQKIEEYEQFQAENIVDSSIIAASSTLINVGTQRALGNKQAFGLILTSKVIGAALTMGTMLGLRTALPTSMKTLDDELGDRYFSKAIRGTQRLFGAEVDAPPAPVHDSQESAASHVGRLAAETKNTWEKS